MNDQSQPSLHRFVLSNCSWCFFFLTWWFSNDNTAYLCLQQPCSWPLKIFSRMQRSFADQGASSSPQFTIKIMYFITFKGKLVLSLNTVWHDFIASLCSKEQELIADWRAGREQLVIDYKRKCQDVGSFPSPSLFLHSHSLLCSVLLHSFLSLAFVPFS